MTMLVTPGAYAPVVARYTTTAAQSIANNATTSTEIVNFGTIDVDTHNAVTTGASWHFTAPVAGRYQVSAHLEFAASAATFTAQCRLNKNGSAVSIGKLTKSGTASLAHTAHISDVVVLAIGDTLDVRAFQDSGGALALSNDALQNHISIHKIGNYQES